MLNLTTLSLLNHTCQFSSPYHKKIEREHVTRIARDYSTKTRACHLAFVRAYKLLVEMAFLKFVRRMWHISCWRAAGPMLAPPIFIIIIFYWTTMPSPNLYIGRPCTLALICPRSLKFLDLSLDTCRARYKWKQKILKSTLDRIRKG